MVARDKTPVVGVVAIVAVISQYKILVRWHGYRTKIIVGLLFNVIFLQRLIVDINAPCLDLHLIARETEQALDEGIFEVLRLQGVSGRKDNNISSFWISEVVADLVNDQAVINLEGWQHRSRRDVTRLRHKATNPKGENSTQGNRLECFYPRVFNFL